MGVSAPDRSIGVGQSWQNVGASRAFNTTYTNTTGRAILVAVRPSSSGGTLTMATQINGTDISAYIVGDNRFSGMGVFIVPAGATYRVNATGQDSLAWWELR